jgi:hypothetical protein
MSADTDTGGSKISELAGAGADFERTALRGFVVLTGVLGLIAFVPVLMAWFSSEELVLFAIMKVDLFAVWFGRDHVPGFFRPVIPLLAWTWAKLFGVNATAFHALSVLLHATNSLLVWGVASQWWRDGSRTGGAVRPGVAAVCGALFWVWPSHSEPV